MAPQLQFWRPETIESCPDNFPNSIRDGVYEAGSPWFDYLFGSPSAARSTLLEWISRKSSEVYVKNCVLATDGPHYVGGFCALTCDELLRCRRADGLTMIARAPRHERGRIQELFAESASLFPMPNPEEYYLSKLWVSPGYRGKGYSLPILQHFLDHGRHAGFLESSATQSRGLLYLTMIKTDDR